MNVSTRAEQKYTSLADTFDQCDASQFNIKIDWGAKFQPKFDSLPDCIQVKPIKEFRLRPSYKDMPFLKIPKNGNTDDYSLGNYYRFADDAFRSSYLTTSLLGRTSFLLPNDEGLGDRYGASPAYQICQYIWYKLDDLTGQKGTAFDPFRENT